jgi:hypothetical protein
MACSVEPGKWYLTAACRCGQWFAFEPSLGPSSPIALPDSFQLVCPACEIEATYYPREIRHALAARSSGPREAHPQGQTQPDAALL